MTMHFSFSSWKMKSFFLKKKFLSSEIELRYRESGFVSLLYLYENKIIIKSRFLFHHSHTPNVLQYMMFVKK